DYYCQVWDSDDDLPVF
nr:immunoglobulin light chain junction region [Macaca mulatta]MOX69954.1 immunoglobulin light chain junction region [Macaca mulatta]MOX71559.1 immunoglobulin light chain junction region [Macaca mulatta]MOX71708.1 immunoglobulin light chain junction region [Macaca mulatta]MOX73402.1 immunoglobulin light chain junction region [Macaca mulatta]